MRENKASEATKAAEKEAKTKNNAEQTEKKRLTNKYNVLTSNQINNLFTQGGEIAIAKAAIKGLYGSANLPSDDKNKYSRNNLNNVKKLYNTYLKKHKQLTGAGMGFKKKFRTGKC